MVRLNAFSTGGLILSLSCLGLVLANLLYGRKKVHYLWALFNLSVAVWGFGAFKVGVTLDRSEAWLWWKINHLGVIWMPVFILHAVLVLCNIRKKMLLRFAYLQGVCFSLLDIFTQSLFFGGLRLVFNSFYYATTGPFYHPFFGTWLFLVIYAHLLVFLRYHSSQGILRKRLLYFLGGTLVGFVGGVTNFLPGYGIDIYPYGNFTIPLYCIIVTYAIIKYRLMDIKIAITRAGIFGFVYTLVLGIPFALIIWARTSLVSLLGSQWWTVPFVLLAVLGSAGPFIYMYLQKKAEDLLLKEQKRYQQALLSLARGMTLIKDLDKLLRTIVLRVSKLMRLKSAGIYLYQPQNQSYTLKYHWPRERKNLPQEFALSSAFIQEILKKRTPFSLDETSSSLNHSLPSQGAIVPSFINHELLGFLILGCKHKGGFTPQDFDMFEALSYQASLAIENALFLQEEKARQERLFHLEKLASLGTMAGGLSHQMGNRLQVIALASSELKDILKFFDKNNPQSLEGLISQVKDVASLLEKEVLHARKIISGILDYSRKKDTQFRFADFRTEVLDDALKVLSIKQPLKNTQINIDIPSSFPPLWCEPSQLTEVFFNLLDNAYEAIEDKRIRLDMRDHPGQITLKAQIQDKKVLFTVKDNGIGVRDPDKTKIFTPYFTTKSSTKSGHGVGMYVVKMVIENHGGRIWFDSKYPEGTAFYVELPLNQTSPSEHSLQNSVQN